MMTNQTAIANEQPLNEWTSIRIHRNTIRKLDRLGRFKESYSEVVDRIASEALGLSIPPDEGS
jgi:hypothetical protein